MSDIQRVIVYIDGFNFYYGLRETKWKKYYWLDMVKLFEQFLRPNQELTAVKYFSARHTDTEKATRQDAFFRANQENSKFKLFLGKYLKKEITCFKCKNVIHTYEEKETDARIVAQIATDAYKGNCDIAIVVSADSDMIPAVELAKEANVKVFVYFPPSQYSYNLSKIGDGEAILLKKYESRFRKALLPPVVMLKNGFELTVPDKWKTFA